MCLALQVEKNGSAVFLVDVGGNKVRPTSLQLVACLAVPACQAAASWHVASEMGDTPSEG